MLSLLAAAVAMAQDVATTAPPHVESMPHGTLGDYTGPVGGIMAVLLALDRFGLLRLGGKEKSGDGPELAALRVRIDAIDTALAQLSQKADSSATDRARMGARLEQLRADHDGLRKQLERGRAEDRREVAGRLDRIAETIETFR